MSTLALRAHGIGKQFRIGRVQNTHPTLRDVIASGASQMLRRLRRPGEHPHTNRRTIWALRDVSFDVRKGEAVGIIGRNGAGKSTLLKILSRITEPTVGRAEIHGRLGSLLEVGTGFHPELTGRENIYLNGAILGMKKAEVDRKFDEIVAFSEVEDFLDTPVKHYSSGMYVRLAFAVAAHLEPEILVIDEVLSVGDAAFQRKCLGKMEEVTQEGRTVLFVSHNMGAVQALCSRAVLLRDGTVFADGPAASVVGTYLGTIEQAASENLLERTERHGKGETRLVRIDVSSGGPDGSATLATGRSARLTFHVTRRLPGLSCSFTIYDQFGHGITYCDSAMSGQEDVDGHEPGNVLCCEIEELLLLPGRYRLNAAIMSNGELQDHVEGAALLVVEQGSLRGRPVPNHSGNVSMLMPHRWIHS